MPNIKSAKKRVLVNEKKNAQNRVQMTIVKTAVKKINNAIDTNNLDEAERLLPEVMSVLDSAVAKGVMHRNTAANKKSGIAKRIADVKAGKKEIVIKKDNKTIAAEKAKAAQEAKAAQRAEMAKRNAEKKAAAEAAKKAEEEAAKAAKKPAAKKATKKADDAEKPAKKATKKADDAEKPAKKPAAKKAKKTEDAE